MPKSRVRKGAKQKSKARPLKNRRMSKKEIRRLQANIQILEKAEQDLLQEQKDEENKDG